MGWNGSAGAPAPRARAAGNRPKRGLLIVCAAVVAVVAAVWLSMSGSSASDEVKPAATKRLKANKKPKKSAKESVRDVMPSGLDKTKRVGNRPRRIPGMFDHLTGEDRRLAEQVQDALDGDDFDKMVAVATDALASTNGEVRLNAVDALGWFGAQALPELTGAMADADEGIRQAAENHFELAVQELEEPADQFAIAMAAFGTLADPDQLTTLGGVVNGAATRLIDDEEDAEKQAENRIAVVQALVDIIEGEGSAVNIAAAKEAYNDITCNEWLGIDEAERYLRDPDNYDPDEPPADDQPQPVQQAGDEAPDAEAGSPSDGDGAADPAEASPGESAAEDTPESDPEPESDENPR